MDLQMSDQLLNDTAERVARRVKGILIRKTQNIYIFYIWRNHQDWLYEPTGLCYI